MVLGFVLLMDIDEYNAMQCCLILMFKWGAYHIGAQHAGQVNTEYMGSVTSYILLTGTMLNLATFCSILLICWQKIVFNARQTCKQQTHFLKQNFSETIIPVDIRCEMLINL